MILDELTWPEIDALDRGRVLPVCVLARRAAQSAPAAGDGPSIGTSSTRRAPIARPAAGTAAGRGRQRSPSRVARRFRYGTRCWPQSRSDSVARHGFRHMLSLTYGGNRLHHRSPSSN